MKLTDKVIKLHDDSLNDLGELPKDGLKTKKKKASKSVVIVEGRKFDRPKDAKLRISVKKQKKILDAFDKRISKNDKAIEMVADEILGMAWEIESSTAGERRHTTIYNPRGANLEANSSTKSDFPTYLQDIFNDRGTKLGFFSSIRAGKSKEFGLIVKEAVGRIYHGYQNAHGYDVPKADFQKILSGEDLEDEYGYTQDELDSIDDYDSDEVPF